LSNFFVAFIFKAAALPSDSSSVSDKTFSAKSFRFFFFTRQKWLILCVFLLIKLIIDASFKIFKELWTTGFTISRKYN